MKTYKTITYISNETIKDIVKKENTNVLNIEYTNGFGGLFHKLFTSDSVAELRNAASNWLENAKNDAFIPTITISTTYYYKSGKRYIETF